jgi:hypothetical protein
LCVSIIYGYFETFRKEKDITSEYDWSIHIFNNH